MSGWPEKKEWQRCAWMKKCMKNGKTKGGKYEFI